MANSDVFHRFRWRDRSGVIWDVEFYNRSLGFSGFAVSNQERGTSTIHVSTHDSHVQQQTMAFP